MVSIRRTLLAILHLVAVVAVAPGQGGDADSDGGEEEVPMVVTFVNELPDTTIELYWEDVARGERRVEASVPPRGGFVDVKTVVGHEFSYDVDGRRNYVTPPAPRPPATGQFVVLVGDADPGLLVRCDPLQRGGGGDDGLGSIDLLVKPYWSPRGASRFLELVRRGFYDGVALSRVVPEFLVQFGISGDAASREYWDERPIFDDHDRGGGRRPFDVGYVSFAGNGPDSRTTEVFIVMPDTPQDQLDYFGENSWETPFAVLQGDVNVLKGIYSGYGDMPPFGEGPDPDRIYDEDGYDYLRANFPMLDYINRCYVVDEEGTGEEELSVEL